MRRKVKKSLTLFMALVMLVSLICSRELSAFAEDVSTTEQTMYETEETTTEASDSLEETWNGQTDSAVETDEFIPQETETFDTAVEPELSEQTITAAMYGGEAIITLSGKMPEGATAEACPVQVSIEGQNVLAAYDITIYDVEGNVFQPEADAIRVEIADAAVAEALDGEEDISVYHMEDAEALPQQIQEVNTENQVVAFDAESFSIYVVTAPETHFTCTYNFHAGDTVNTQILSAGEILNEPETPASGENQIFDGWYTVNGDKFTGFGTVQPQMTESRIIDLYAQYKKAYYVFYMSAVDSEGSRRVIFTQTYGSGDKVLSEDVPYSTGNTETALIGWSENENAEEPESDLVIGNEDIRLYPVIKNAHWITYDSAGGSAVEPTYVLTNRTTIKPKDPTRLGYEFLGWYDKDGKQFQFGSALPENIILHAEWRPSQAAYTAIYWLQNAEDDNYSYVGKSTLTGTVDEEATIVGAGNDIAVKVGNDTKRLNDTACFVLNNDMSSKEVTIAGDGTAIKNIYYDRQTFTLTFQVEVQQGWFQKDWKTVYSKDGLKYGQKTDQWWAEASRENPGKLWYTKKDGTTFYTASPAMDNSNLTIYGKDSSGTSTIYYYEDNTQTQIHEAFQVNKRGWTFTSEDYIAIEGFTYKSSSYGSKYNNDEYYIYYTRNRYNIDFLTNGGPEVPPKNEILFEANISNQEPSEYIVGETYKEVDGIKLYFAGWYDNSDFVGEPFEFAGKTMPARNLNLYAKWMPKKVTVTFDTNGGSEIAQQIIDAGGKAEKPDNPTRNKDAFAGWTKDGRPFNFDTQIVEDVTLVAQWISNEKYTITYEPGNGSGEDVIDVVSYASGVKAKILKVPTDWVKPNDSKGFICWMDSEGKKYYPGDTYIMPDHHVVLTAQWAEVRSTTLTYNFNGGADADNKTSMLVNIDVPNSEYTIAGPVVSRAGYEFIGWTTDRAGIGTLLKNDDKIQVDTLNPDNNVLYAQWRKMVTVTVRKFVDGNMGDTNESFDFTYTVTKPDGTTEDPAFFALKDGETYPITDLPQGSSVIVTETSQAADGYSTTVTVGDTTTNSNEYSGQNLTDDVTVTFTNTKNVTAPTGIVRNVFPFIVMVVIAIEAIICFVVWHLKKRIR